MKAHLVRILLVLAVVTAACSSDEPMGLAGIVRTPHPDVSGVTLPDVTEGHSGDHTAIARPGGLLLVYFGYTSCPDVCPTTMADLRKAMRTLDESLTAKIDVAFVTVDPGRDTGQILSSYVRAFFPERGIALRTEDPDTLAAAADAFGAIYRVGEDDEGNTIVEHSAFLYVVDDTGSLLLSWPFGIQSDLIANDLRLLMEEEAT